MKLNGLQFLHSEKKMPATSLPVRTTVADVAGGRVMISPGSMLTEAQLRSVSGVTDIVAPNRLHAGGVAAAAKVFPEARLWGPTGIRDVKPEIKWTNELTPADWPYEADLPLFLVDGAPTADEVVFLHKASHALIVTDLFFNVRNVKDLGGKVIFGLFGTLNRFAFSRLFKMSVKDRPAFEKAMGRIVTQGFDRIIVSHGEIAEGGPDLFRQALAERGFSPLKGDRA